MALLHELKSRARHVVGPVFGILAIGYFVYHGVQGDRGWLAYRQLVHEVAKAERVAASVRAERDEMERRVGLLHPKSLNPDMLDERARLMLNLGLAGEIVILLPPDQHHR